MEEKIEIWQVGNTGLRNPNRIQEGFKAFANSPYVGNLRKENEIDFMNFLILRELFKTKMEKIHPVVMLENGD